MSISRRVFVRVAAGFAAVGLGGVNALAQTAGQRKPEDVGKGAAPVNPDTQPARPPTTLRKPEQAEILKKMLQEQEAPPPILQQPEKRGGTGVVEVQPGGDGGSAVLSEGTSLVERPGRLVVNGDRAEFIFNVEGEGRGPQSMEILKNQFLEAMEREAQKGLTQFVISGEVTRYHGRNYLILRKVLRRVNHENLAP